MSERAERGYQVPYHTPEKVGTQAPGQTERLRKEIRREQVLPLGSLPPHTHTHTCSTNALEMETCTLHHCPSAHASTFFGSSWFDRSSPWARQAWSPLPHVKTAPSAVMAKLWYSPADTALTR